MLGPDGRPGDPPLTEKGHRQAYLAAQRVAREGLDVLYCGPLLRNLQTAVHIYEATGIRPVLMPYVFEVGANNMLWPPDAITRQFPMVHLENGWRGWRQAMPETFEQACQRIAHIHQWLRERHETSEARVGVITHGTLNDLLIGVCLGMTPGSHARFSSANCAFHWLEMRPQIAKLIRLNDLCHLPDTDQS